jgi:hypothetical protein
MRDFIDKTSASSGTLLNRSNMMALQGFDNITTTFNADGSITERNGAGQVKTTTFNEDGSITERFVGEKTISKTTTFSASGNIIEVIG